MRSEEATLQETIVNLSAALLIWLFGVLVFLPLAVEIDPEGFSVLISIIVFSAFSVFLIKSLKGLGDLIAFASDFLTKEWIMRRKVEDEKLILKTKEKISVVLQALTLIVIYLLYSPLLTAIHPSINGIGIIVTLLGIFFIALKATQHPRVPKERKPIQKKRKK